MKRLVVLAWLLATATVPITAAAGWGTTIPNGEPLDLPPKGETIPSHA